MLRFVQVCFFSGMRRQQSFGFCFIGMLLHQLDTLDRRRKPAVLLSFSFGWSGILLAFMFCFSFRSWTNNMYNIGGGDSFVLTRRLV